MKLLIIGIGFIGDNILAANLAQNCKKFGEYSQVDLLIGLPHIAELLAENEYIDNVLVSSHPNPYVNHTGVGYDKVYTIDYFEFAKRPLDKFNEKLNLPQLEYDFSFNIPTNMVRRLKPTLSFQLDWNQRSWGPQGVSRDVQKIMDGISDKWDILLIGSNNSQQDVNPYTSIKFKNMTDQMAQTDLFFGFPGGMHWVAAAAGLPTMTTSEHVIRLYDNNGEFRGGTFEEFTEKWMIHAGKHYSNDHILLQPEITDDEIISKLNEYANHI